MVALATLIVLLVIIYVFAASSFTAATFSRFTGVDTIAAQFLTLCIPTLFVATMFISLRCHSWFLQLAANASSVAMGFLNFASLAAVLCWPIWWVVSVAAVELDRALIAWTLYGCSVPVGIFGLVNARTLRVTTYDISLPNLPDAWHGRRVAVVSDIHVGHIFGPRFVRKVVKQLSDLQPSALFISGDMFDGAVVDIAKAVEPWAGFQAPAGAYFVTGNHEEIGDRTPYLTALSRGGIIVLQNEKVVVDGLQIVGVHDGEAHRRTVYEAVLERANLDPTRASILLVHRPGRLDVAENAGISLQVSGHTHAGQFQPFSFLVRLIYGRFGYGHHRHGSLQVVTSSGAGTGGPPFRVGTRSEIVMIQLQALPAVV